MSTSLPSVTDVNYLFAMLFGHETVCKTRKVALPANDTVIVASYLDNEGRIKRLLTCDMSFANSAGAALSAIPAGAANDAIKAGEVPANIMANLSEVMNVAVNLFTDSFGGRLELAAVARQADLTPEAKAALASTQRVRIDVSIPRYIVGRVDLIAI